MNNNITDKALASKPPQLTLMNEKVKLFFNNEISPAEFSQVMDDAYFVISQMAIASPADVPKGEYNTDELLYYLHKFKRTIA